MRKYKVTMASNQIEHVIKQSSDIFTLDWAWNLTGFLPYWQGNTKDGYHKVWLNKHFTLKVEEE